MNNLERKAAEVQLGVLKLQHLLLESQFKKGGGKPGRGGAGRWVTIMGRHVFIGSDGVPRQGPNGPKVDVDAGRDGGGESKPKQEAEKPKPKQEEKPKFESRQSLQVDHSLTIKEDDIGKDWEGMRASIAIGAVRKMERGHPGIVVKEGGKPVAVASYELIGRKTLYVSYVATKKSGLGAKVMADLCKKAAASGRGVALEGFTDAKGFYEKIGMKKEGKEGPTGNQAYSFNAAEAKSFADRYANEHKSLWDELKSLEPKNGVFAVENKLVKS